MKWFLAAWPLLLSPVMVWKGFSIDRLGMVSCGRSRLDTKVGGLAENFPMQRVDQADIGPPTRNEIFVTTPVQAIPLQQQHDVVQVRGTMLVVASRETDEIWVHAAPLPT